MQCEMVLGKPFMSWTWFLHTHVSHIRRSEPPGVCCRTPGFEMQIGKQWQRLNKHSANKCAWSQQAKPHMLAASAKPACEWLATTVAFLLSLLKSRLLFFYIYFTTVTPTHRNNLLDVLWPFHVCFPWLLPPQPWIYQPMFRPCGIRPPHWIRRPRCQQKLLCSRSRLWPASSWPCWLNHLVSNNLWIHIVRVKYCV